MNYNFVKNLLRRHLSNDLVYNRARRALLLGQYLLRRPDEADFNIFKNFGARRDVKLVIDVGANGGQSVFAFAFLFPNARIISFEPNISLASELEFARRVIGKRYEFRSVGLGEQAQETEIYVPKLGNMHISTRASVDINEMQKKIANLEVAYGRKIEADRQDIKIIPFDSLELAPDVIKIDVEGYERFVLGGMRKTLQSSHPLLVCEENTYDKECFAILEEFGYEIFYFDLETQRLGRSPRHAARNWYALKPEHIAAFGPFIEGHVAKDCARLL